MSYTQQQLAEMFKKLIPTATENDSSVALTINGVSIELSKNIKKSQVTTRSQNIYR